MAASLTSMLWACLSAACSVLRSGPQSSSWSLTSTPWLCPQAGHPRFDVPRLLSRGREFISNLSSCPPASPPVPPPRFLNLTSVSPRSMPFSRLFHLSPQFRLQLGLSKHLHHKTGGWWVCICQVLRRALSTYQDIGWCCRLMLGGGCGWWCHCHCPGVWQLKRHPFLEGTRPHNGNRGNFWTQEAWRFLVDFKE